MIFTTKMASVETYEVPEHLQEFVEEKLQDSYFDIMLKSSFNSNLSFDKITFLNSIYLMKTNKLYNILEKFNMTINFNNAMNKTLININK